MEVFVDQRRKIESEAEARRCLAAVKASSLSAKEWARSHGIDGRSLHAWQMNLERWSPRSTRKRWRATTKNATTSSKMQLVELVPSSAPSASRYVLRVGSASVEFGDEFDAATLRRVIEVLRSC